MRSQAQEFTAAPAHTCSSSRTARQILVALMATSVLAWTAWWGFKHMVWWTLTGREIAQIVRAATRVNETLLTPPQAYRNVPITAAEMAALSRAAQRKLADYYTGPPPTVWRAVASRTLNAKDLHRGKTSAWMTWWRVDWVHLGELTLLPASATVTAAVEVRSNAGVVDRVDYTWHLVPTRVGWRIDREDFEFEPGYGP